MLCSSNFFILVSLVAKIVKISVTSKFFGKFFQKRFFLLVLSETKNLISTKSRITPFYGISFRSKGIKVL